MIESMAFALGLAGGTLASVISGNRGMRRTALTLAAVWLLCMIAVTTLRDPAPWWAFLLIDLVACYIVTRHPASRPQAIIGALFLFQIMFHLIFAVHLAGLAVGSAPASGFYLSLLAMVGWLQIATLFWGAIYGGGNRHHGPAVRWHLSDAGAAYHRRVGKMS